MSDTTRAEGKFLSTRAGVTAFAWVRVEFISEPESSGARVRLALAKQLDRDNGQVDEAIAPDWCKAALDGVEAALSILGDIPPGVVVITSIQGTVADTNTDAVSRAAGLAVAQLFGRELIG